MAAFCLLCLIIVIRLVFLTVDGYDLLDNKLQSVGQSVKKSRSRYPDEDTEKSQEHTCDEKSVAKGADDGLDFSFGAECAS